MSPIAALTCQLLLIPGSHLLHNMMTTYPALHTTPAADVAPRRYYRVGARADHMPENLSARRVVFSGALPGVSSRAGRPALQSGHASGGGAPQQAFQERR